MIRPRAMTKARRDALVQSIAAACAAWILDDGSCHFCEFDNDEDTSIRWPHGDDCPFRGVSDDDVRAIAGVE